MKAIEFNVEARTTCGKGPARRARRSGRVPAVFYGPRRQPIPLLIDAREFAQKIARGDGSPLVRMTSGDPGLEGRLGLLKDVQYHPVSGALLHADFYEVDLEHTLRIRVPLHFTGKAAGVAAGGILQPLRREVEVECLPLDIPSAVDVDVSRLGIHDTIRISEVQPPAGARFVFDDDFGIVTVLPPTVEEVRGEAAGEAAAEQAGTATEAPARSGGEK